MDRRCNNDQCLLEASKKAKSFTIDLPVASILHNPKKEWSYAGNNNVRIARDINIDWNKFSADKYLFSHCSIVSSCNVEENGYYVKAPTDELVNNNGNGWSDEVLLACFRSFVGAENYLEHVQIPELSKGKILDAVLRPVTYTSKTGKKANVYYTDILVATSRKHTDLVRKIESGELTTMSMGCQANWTQCSKCGKEFTDNSVNCDHLDNELMTYFVDENGISRIVAELCGRTIIGPDGKRKGDPKSCVYIEASWVERPAFQGAVLNHYISEVDTKKYASILNMSTPKLEEIFSDLGKLRVADRNGMLVLHVACAELRRRKEEQLIDRVSIWAAKH